MGVDGELTARLELLLLCVRLMFVHTLTMDPIARGRFHEFRFLLQNSKAHPTRLQKILFSVCNNFWKTRYLHNHFGYFRQKIIHFSHCYSYYDVKIAMNIIILTIFIFWWWFVTNFFYKTVREFTDKNVRLISRVILILILIIDITFHAHYLNFKNGGYMRMLSLIVNVSNIRRSEGSYLYGF